MRSIFTIILLNLTINVFGQTDLGQELPTFNLFNDADYTIKAYKYNEELKFKYVISKTGKETEEFVLETNVYETFEYKFEKTIQKIEEDTAEKVNNISVKAEAKRVFFIYISASKTLGDLKGPLAGELSLRKNVTIRRRLEPSMIKYLKKKAKRFRKNRAYVKKYKRTFTSLFIDSVTVDKVLSGNNKKKKSDHDEQLSDVTPIANQKEVVSQTTDDDNQDINRSDVNSKQEGMRSFKKKLEEPNEIQDTFQIWKGAVNRREVKFQFINFVENYLVNDLMQEFHDKERSLCHQLEGVIHSIHKYQITESRIKDLNQEIIDLNDTLNLKIKDERASNRDSVNITNKISNFLENKITTIISEIEYFDKDLNQINAELQSHEDSLRELDSVISVLNNDTIVRIEEKVDSIKKYTNEITTLKKQVADIIDQKDSLYIYQQIISSLKSFFDGKEVSKNIYRSTTFKNQIDTILSKKYNHDSLKNEFYTLTEDIEDYNRIQEKYVKIKEEKKVLEKNIEVANIKLEEGQNEKNDILKKNKKYRSAYWYIIDSLSVLSKNLPELPFSISSAQLEFKDGFIENLRITGQTELNTKDFCTKIDYESLDLHSRKVNTLMLKFDNYFPLGFSREKDFQELNSGDQPKIVATTSNRNRRKGDVYYMPTSELFENYIQEHKVGRRDFSPKNDMVNFEFDGDSTQEIQAQRLYKIERRKLFEARVYSDFLGFNQQNENGLIQTEVIKQLNINTKRRTFSKYRFNYFLNFGYFTYITPILTLSKIEDNNRHLLIDYKNNFVNNQYDPIRFVTTLALRSHENFSTGFDVNLFLLDLPNFKSTFLFDAGFRYGKTLLRDSIQVFENNEVVRTGEAFDRNSDTFRFTPLLITWRLQTDERFQFDFNWSWNLMYLRNNNVKQVANKETFLQDDTNSSNEVKDRTYYRLELNAQYNTNNNNSGKLFFRYRYFRQHKFWNTGFSQVQLGYSFFLMAAVRNE